MSNNFITNTKESVSLKERLQKLIEVSYELKFLVGFFYFSSWQEIYKKLKENNEVKLKILVGLQTDKYISKIIEIDHDESKLSNQQIFSRFLKSLGYAINNDEMDNEEFNRQVEFFIQMLEENRLIIRKTREPNHAKLYLFKLKENNFGLTNEFITGSSNLTKYGLSAQKEFNVEIRDYGFDKAEEYFDELWEKAIPITENIDNKKIILNFIKEQTHIAQITPYEAYAYVLKTYIDLYETNRIKPDLDQILSKNKFKKYRYQLDAVNQALNIIHNYNGVIIADVVGLGKSVIASMIAHQLGKRGLIICPPGLIGNRKEGTGWYEYINKFALYNWDIESSGNIEEIEKALQKQDLGYEVIIVDEAHRFRNQDTKAYEALANITRGKIVILLTATPFNNSPADIFSLLKLFIVPGQSSITLEKDMESRFNAYNNRFKNLSIIIKNHNSTDEKKKEKAEKKYIEMFGKQPPIDIKFVKKNIKQMANDIKNIISPIVIRRNRLDLQEDFLYKNEITTLSKIKDPVELFYELTKEQSEFYDTIIKEYFKDNGKFKGAIYRPFEYETEIKDKKRLEENRTYLQQYNLFNFMRHLLVKRFESSFGAFTKSIDKFLKVHKMVYSFIQTSGKYILDRKIIESIYNEDEEAEDFTIEAIKEALEKFKKKAEEKILPKHIKIYEINKFKYKKKFLDDIKNDIKLFEDIQEKIEKLKLVENDPKREKVLSQVKNILKKENNPKRKVVIFSEYSDTVRHLKIYFEQKLNNRVLFCDGNLPKSLQNKINENFNAQYDEKKQKDNYDVLITTDKLSEGINLNRAGAIINYDIPWNPTRVIQRVGRINRIGKKVFDELYIYNLFPTEQGANQVKIREIAQQKMFLIHNALGEDAKILDPDEEPTPSKLFRKINTNPEDNENEISLITFIRNEYKTIKDKHPEVIEKIEKLPNRTKTAKQFTENNLIVFRKKGLSIFSLISYYNNKIPQIEEKNFEDLIKKIKCEYNEPRLKLSDKFWQSYINMKKFETAITYKKSPQNVETEAFNSLKTLLGKNTGLKSEIISFIYTLIEDIKYYKTLPKYTLRKLVLPKTTTKDPYNELIKNIEELKKEIGNDYLQKVKSKLKNTEAEMIIAIENQKK